MNPAISVHLSLRATSSLEEIFVIDLHPDRDLPPCDDGDFALFAAVMVTQAADCPADFQSGEEALPSMLRLGAIRNEGRHVSPLNVSSSSYPNIDAAHSTGDSQHGDLSIDGITHDRHQSFRRRHARSSSWRADETSVSRGVYGCVAAFAPSRL